MKNFTIAIFAALLSLSISAEHHQHQHDDSAFKGLGAGIFVGNNLASTFTPMVSYRMPWFVAGLGLSFSVGNKDDLRIPLFAGVNMNVCKGFDFQAGLIGDLKFNFQGDTQGTQFSGLLGAFVGGELAIWKHLALTVQVLPYYYDAEKGQHNFFRGVGVGMSYIL